MEEMIGELFPKIFMLACCSVIVIPFTVLIVVLIKKSKQEGWSGVILKKVHNTTTDMDDNQQENYYFEVKMDDGSRNRNVAVSTQLFNEAKEGDKIKKEKGKLIPELVK
jgi:hypothetical protein